MKLVAEGRRVVLRRLREEDITAVEAWYGEAAMAAGIPHPLPLSRSSGEGRPVEDGASDLLVVERVSEPGPIGVVDYAVRDVWVTMGFIALAKSYRGWGYGSEAVRLLEEWATGNGSAERFRAKVPVGNGLGLYFWLRLGYRPAGRHELGWPPDERRDMMPMVRQPTDT